MWTRISAKRAFPFFWAFLFLASCGVKKSLRDMPDISRYETDIPERRQINDSTFVLGNNFLTKERGRANGNYLWMATPWN